MKNVKTVCTATLAIGFAAFLQAFAATSTPKGFTDNLDEALDAARQNGKYVYVCFSGSDWCGWCRKLEREVFSKAAFRDGVMNDYELVFIDLPQDESLLSEHAKANNRKLVEKYAIEGFPTALILEPDGSVVAKTGYRKGGSAKYVEHLKEIREKGPVLKIVEKYVSPFEDDLSNMAREFSRKVQAHVEAEVAKGGDEATLKSEAFSRESPMFKEFIAKVEGRIAEFEKQEFPAEVEKSAKAVAESARKWIDSLGRPPAKPAE